MFPRSRFAAALIVAMSVLPHSGSALSAQSQIVDFASPPDTLAELWNQSTIVVRVRTISSAARAVDLNSPSGPLAVTEHTMDVLEVFKDDPLRRGRARIPVAVQKATLDTPGRRLETLSAESTFEADAEAVLFLAVWPTADAFSVAYGPSGAFRLDAVNVVIPDGARPYAEFHGRRVVPRREFLDIIRALK